MRVRLRVLDEMKRPHEGSNVTEDAESDDRMRQYLAAQPVHLRIESRVLIGVYRYIYV